MDGEGVGEQDAEALRRRLYRPDASAADLADYLRTTRTASVDAPDLAVTPDARNAPDPRDVPDLQHAADPEDAPPARARPGRSPFVVGGALVAGAALLGAVLLTSGPTPAPAVRTTRAPTTAAVAEQDGRSTWSITFAPGAVLDGGARDHARGASVAEGPESVRYTVAEDDTAIAIARRFRLCPSDVLQALPYGFDPARLPAGTSLELSRLEATGC